MDGSLHARVSSGAAHAGFVRHRHMSVSDKDVRGTALTQHVCRSYGHADSLIQGGINNGY